MTQLLTTDPENDIIWINGYRNSEIEADPIGANRPWNQRLVHCWHSCYQDWLAMQNFWFIIAGEC